MFLRSETAAGVLVGLLWGCTNPLIKRGSVQVQCQAAGGAAPSGSGVIAEWRSEWRSLLRTPAFLLPQLINQVRAPAGKGCGCRTRGEGCGGGAAASPASTRHASSSIARSALPLLPTRRATGCSHPPTPPPPHTRARAREQQCGSVLFALLLGSDARLSAVVPLANATALAANALCDLALGEAFRLHLLLPGLALVAAGLALCAAP